MDFKQCQRTDGTVYGIPESSDCGKGKPVSKSNPMSRAVHKRQDYNVVTTGIKNGIFTEKTQKWIDTLDKERATRLLGQMNRNKHWNNDERKATAKKYIDAVYKQLHKIEKAEGIPSTSLTSHISSDNVKKYNLNTDFAEAELGDHIPTYAESKEDMPCNKPKRQTQGGKSHVVKACGKGLPEDGKLIRFGDANATTAGAPKEGESEKQKARRKSFKARHAKNIAKGPSSAAYWADKVKWCEGATEEDMWSAIEFAEEQMDLWEFKTCQRKDGSTYGIPNEARCGVGHEVSSKKEVTSRATAQKGLGASFINVNNPKQSVQGKVDIEPIDGGFKMKWSDGAADKFTQTGPTTFTDSRGGEWQARNIKAGVAGMKSDGVILTQRSQGKGSTAGGTGNKIALQNTSVQKLGGQTRGGSQSQRSQSQRSQQSSKPKQQSQPTTTSSRSARKLGAQDTQNQARSLYNQMRMAGGSHNAAMETLYDERIINKYGLDWNTCGAGCKRRLANDMKKRYDKGGNAWNGITGSNYRIS